MQRRSEAAEGAHRPGRQSGGVTKWGRFGGIGHLTTFGGKVAVSK